MKRLHVHIRTQDLDKSVAYYTALFGAAPEKRRDDYARWLLDDPYAHVSVSTHDGASGIDHVGVSIDNPDDLEAYAERLTAANMGALPETGTTCCYANSDKYWSRGPDGEVWELFRTYGDSDTYGVDRREELEAAASSHCCG
ncbi:MAG: ArsI/CadI family heavy metal resistance metalloenzyme [Pseudomonadota bacterium]